jgi:hypothetical protein
MFRNGRRASIIRRAQAREAATYRRADGSGPRRSKHLPAIGSDLNGTPTLVGKIKIEAAGMLSDADVDYPLGAIKLRARFE